MQLSGCGVMFKFGLFVCSVDFLVRIYANCVRSTHLQAMDLSRDEVNIISMGQSIPSLTVFVLMHVD